MRAVRIHRYGGLEAIMYEEVSRPSPSAGEVLVRVKVAGAGPWDAWVRAGKSALPQPLPLTLGSDLAGVVEDVGAGVSGFHPGDDVLGVTKSQFTGAYAEYAVADAGMIARKPRRLSYVEAASVPVVASTAWQMVFDHGQVTARKRCLYMVLPAMSGPMRSSSRSEPEPKLSPLPSQVMWITFKPFVPTTSSTCRRCVSKMG